MVLMTGYSLVSTVRPDEVSVVLGAVMTDVTGKVRTVVKRRVVIPSLRVELG